MKFQKSCLPEKFTKKALEKPYSSKNSWGHTYGAHKEYLEFSLEQFRDLQNYANQLGIIFSSSAMDPISLEQLYSLDLPFIKIGSGDANNFPMLQYAAARHTPLVISTGMQTEQTLYKIVEIMKNANKTDFCLMHCVSAYPTEDHNTNLQMIKKLKVMFPEVCIGYSGHEQGIAITVAAGLLGAKIIERHFTLDKNQKGTDHSLSLVPNELNLLTTQLKIIHRDFKSVNNLTEIIKIMEGHLEYTDTAAVSKAYDSFYSKEIHPWELDCYNKLGKSLVYAKYLNKGHILTSNDMCVKVSEPKGISPDKFHDVIGSVLKADVLCDTPLQFDHIV